MRSPDWAAKQSASRGRTEHEKKPVQTTLSTLNIRVSLVTDSPLARNRTLRFPGVREIRRTHFRRLKHGKALAFHREGLARRQNFGWFSSIRIDPFNT